MTTTETAEARAFYAAILETSTEGSRWYIWKSGDGPNYIGGKIASKSDAEHIAAELNRLASLTPPAQGGEWRWVPVEPTEAMCKAAFASTWLGETPADVDADSVSDIWSAMLSAIPDASPGSEDLPVMTPEEHQLEDLKQQATYTGPVVSFDVREPYYLASCDHCGWVGSSELCTSDESDDVFCPRCFTSGADCGKIAERLGSPAPTAEGLRSALDPENYLWKWVERGLFDKRTCTAKEALEVMAYHPSAPWMNGRWDVDHKPYSETFYTSFPKARAALSDAGEERA